MRSDLNQSPLQAKSPRASFMPVGEALSLSQVHDDTTQRMVHLDRGMRSIVAALQRERQEKLALCMLTFCIPLGQEVFILS